MYVNLEVRRWGNSVGVVIPKEVVRKLHVKAGDQVVIDIQKRDNPLKELFGSMKFSKPTKELLAEVRAEMDSKWM